MGYGYYSTKAQDQIRQLYNFPRSYEFSTTLPIITIETGYSYLFPLGEGTVELNNPSGGTTITATYYPTGDIITSSTIHSIESNQTITLVTGMTSSATFNIILCEYIDAHTLFLMYNWATSTTKLSATYSRVLYVSADIFKMSNADSTFAASLLAEDVSTAGSVYAGFVSKTDYDGAYNRMGIAYIRKHITAANVLTSQTLYHGYVAAHVTTSGSYRYITKSLNSSLQLTTSASTMKLCQSDSNFFYAVAGVSCRYYFHRDSAVAAGTGGMANVFRTSGTGYIQTSTSGTSYHYQVIGKLSDGNLLAAYTFTENRGDTYSHLRSFVGSVLCILDYNKAIASNTTNAVIAQISISSSDTCARCVFCLDGDIVCLGDSANGLYELHQIRRKYGGSSFTYEMESLGTVYMSRSVDTETIDSNKKYGATFPKFTGLYSSTYNKLSSEKYKPKALSADVTALSTACSHLAAATVGNYALFAGGYGSSYSAVVDAYNASLTRSTPTSLSTGRYDLAAATVGNYALFGGGYGGSYSYFAVVDAYKV